MTAALLRRCCHLPRRDGGSAARKPTRRGVPARRREPARCLPLRRRDPRRRRGSAAQHVIRNVSAFTSSRRRKTAGSPARAGLFSDRGGEPGKRTAHQRWLWSRRIANPVAHQFLQTPQLGPQILQFAVTGCFPALERLGDKILQSPNLVGENSRFRFSSRVGGFEVGNDGYDILKGGIDVHCSFGF